MQVLYLGRAPRTKETLPDFREKYRVTRHSRVFRGLMGSQRTPGIWGVTKQALSFHMFVSQENTYLTPTLSTKDTSPTKDNHHIINKTQQQKLQCKKFSTKKIVQCRKFTCCEVEWSTRRENMERK